MFFVNGERWDIEYCRPYSSKLMRSDGSYTLGVTDDNRKTVYIDDTLRGYMHEKVLCHELVHVYSFANNLDIPVDTEEVIADFMSVYGRDIINMVDMLLETFIWRQAA